MKKWTNSLMCLAMWIALSAGTGVASPNRGPQAKALALPTVDQLIAKYVQAVGGRAAIQKVHSRVTRGTMDLGGGTIVPLELSEKAPDKFLSVFEVPGEGEARQGFDGQVGWQYSKSGVVELSGELLAAIRRNSQFYRWLRMRELFQKLEVTGSAKVGDRDAFTMVVTPPEGDAETFYFDAITGLLLRRDYNLNSPSGALAFESYYEDYRVVDGIKLPFILRRVGPDGVVILKYTEIKHDVELDDARFAKPALQ
jgi:hypothetical protein